MKLLLARRMTSDNILMTSDILETSDDMLETPETWFDRLPFALLILSLISNCLISLISVRNMEKRMKNLSASAHRWVISQRNQGSSDEKTSPAARKFSRSVSREDSRTVTAYSTSTAMSDSALSMIAYYLFIQCVSLASDPYHIQFKEVFQSHSVLVLHLMYFASACFVVIVVRLLARVQMHSVIPKNEKIGIACSVASMSFIIVVLGLMHRSAMSGEEDSGETYPTRLGEHNSSNIDPVDVYIYFTEYVILALFSTFCSKRKIFQYLETTSALESEELNIDQGVQCTIIAKKDVASIPREVLQENNCILLVGDDILQRLDSDPTQEGLHAKQFELILTAPYSIPRTTDPCCHSMRLYLAMIPYMCAWIGAYFYLDFNFQKFQLESNCVFVVLLGALAVTSLWNLVQKLLEIAICEDTDDSQ